MTISRAFGGLNDIKVQMLACFSREKYEGETINPAELLWRPGLEERGHMCHWDWVKSGSFWKSSGRAEGASCTGLLLQWRRMSQHKNIHTLSMDARSNDIPCAFKYSKWTLTRAKYYLLKNIKTHSGREKNTAHILGWQVSRLTCTHAAMVNTNKWQTRGNTSRSWRQQLSRLMGQLCHSGRAQGNRPVSKASKPPSSHSPQQEWVMVGDSGIEMMLIFWLYCMGEKCKHHPRDKWITMCYVLTSIFIESKSWRLPWAIHVVLHVLTHLLQNRPFWKPLCSILVLWMQRSHCSQQLFVFIYICMVWKLVTISSECNSEFIFASKNP